MRRSLRAPQAHFNIRMRGVCVCVCVCVHVCVCVCRRCGFIGSLHSLARSCCRCCRQRAGISYDGCANYLRQERIELPTLGLWDLRATNCATAACGVCCLSCARAGDSARRLASPTQMATHTHTHTHGGCASQRARSHCGVAVLAAARHAHGNTSATGTRTRVARVRAEYPNQLDYSGVACEAMPRLYRRARGGGVAE